MKIFDIISALVSSKGQGRPDLLAFDSRPSTFLYFFQAHRAAFKGWGFHKRQSFYFHRSLNVVPTTPPAYFSKDIK